MSRFINNPIKSFRPQINGNRSPSAGHMVILKSRSDSSTSSDSINILSYLPTFTDAYWYLYDKDDYIGKIETLDIHSVYTDGTNKFSINPRESRQYDTSNPCSVLGNTGYIFYECELLKNHDLLKRHCIQFSPFKKRSKQLQTNQSTSSISNINTTNETDLFDTGFIMSQE